ncbi:MAG: SusC/RagA family TonB-linked outer membrane protein, partial [Bacteroidetes bacterium]
DILGPENGGSYGGSKGAGLTNTNNPVAVLNRNADNRGRRLRTFGNVYGQLEIIKGLNAKSSIGVDYNQFAGSYFAPINYEAAEPSSANTLNEVFNLFYSWTWTNTLEYKPNLGDNMDLSVLAGTEAIDSYYRGFSAGRANFFTDNVDYRVLSAGTSAISNGGYQGSYALFSYFGKVDYSLNDHYILSATIRRDGSSRFGAANRFGNFPAVSAGWRVSEESFMDGGPFSDLKVRAGWGQTGNQFIGDYSTQSAYGLSRTTSSYDINGTNSSLVDGFDKQLSGNPNLKWEAVTSTNVGIDFGLFKNRLSGTLDLYERKTTGMLYRPTQPGTFGISSNPNQNIGEMRNRGIDFLVSFKSAPASDFTYDLSFNISTYKNEVLKLSEDVGSTLFSGGTRQGNTTQTTVGAPIGMFYGYEVLGIYQTAEEVAADGNPPGVTFATPADGIGRYRIKDVTGPGADGVLGTADDAPDGVLNSDDKTVIGNPHPDFTYGFNAAFGYKNFDLTIFLQGSQGNDLYNYTAYFTDYFSFQGNQSVRMAEQSWTPQNASTATLPKLNRNQPAYELEAHSRFIEDGSYLRVKNVQLGYTLPKSALSKIGFNRARIYVQATNLLTITKYTGFDPEVGVRDQFGDGTDLSIGLDDGAYPVSRTFVAGISLNL